MKPRRIISLQFGLLALVLLPTAVRAQTEAEVKANYTKTEQTIAMRDGVKLFTSIYVPKDKSKKYPIMVFYRNNIELPFFNCLLKDECDHNLPEAFVFETGSNQWRSYDHWPPLNTEKKDLFLQSN